MVKPVEAGVVQDEAPPSTSRQRSLGRRVLLPFLSIIGLASLTYLLGAAVIFFDLPSSAFLHKAFVGARAWYERKQAESETPSHGLPTVLAFF